MKKIAAFLLAINLDPKMIVTALLNLAFGDFLARVKSISAALKTNEALFPGIGLLPDNLVTEVGKLDALETKEDNLVQELKANTEAKEQQKQVVNDMIVDQVCTKVQNTPGVTVENIKLVGLGIKGVDDQQSEPAATATNSHPVFGDIEYAPLTHTFNARNSVTGKFGLPAGVLYTEVREQIGGDQPTDYKKMDVVGRMIRGKFSNHFNAADKGKDVYYFLIYVPKNPGDSPELGGITKRTII